MIGNRQSLHALVTAEAGEGWDHLTDEASFVTIIEAIGLAVRDEMKDGGDLPDRYRDWITAARRLDAQRRRRG